MLTTTGGAMASEAKATRRFCERCQREQDFTEETKDCGFACVYCGLPESTNRKLRADRRERIATVVLAGAVANASTGQPKSSHAVADADLAVDYADALMAALDKAGA